MRAQEEIKGQFEKVYEDELVNGTPYNGACIKVEDGLAIITWYAYEFKEIVNIGFSKPSIDPKLSTIEKIKSMFWTEEEMKQVTMTYDSKNNMIMLKRDIR